MNHFISENKPFPTGGDRFQPHKDFYVINYECIMTEGQAVRLYEQYYLADFTSKEVKLNEVVFCGADREGKYLRLELFDIMHTVLINKCYDTNTPEYQCKWFLIEESVFKDDLLEFEF